MFPVEGGCEDMVLHDGNNTSLIASPSPLPPPLHSLQASKQCADSKDTLEMMCSELAEELSFFDLQKEKEIKQILLDYAASQLERHEKVGVVYLSLTS